MSDPLLELIYDIDHNGIRWVSIVTIIALLRKERRNHLLNLRDKRYSVYFRAILDNQKVLMESRGVGEKWKDGPNLGLNLKGLPNFGRLFSLLRKAMKHQKRRMVMEKLKSRKLWITIVAAQLLVVKEGLEIPVDSDTVLAFAGIVISAILGLAHVDAKKIEATNKPTDNGSDQFN